MPFACADRFALLALVAAALAAAPADARVAPASRTIGAAERARIDADLVYVQESGERRRAFVMRADGSGERPLDDATVDSYPAAVSARGEVALVRVEEAGGHAEALVTVDLVTGARRPLAPSAGQVRNPVFTPDGAVVFESAAASFRDLYRARAGQAASRLTDDPEGNFEPSVFPDGSLAFTSSRDGDAEIYKMDADGRAPRRLSRSPGEDLTPRVSPDGRRVAFLSTRTGADRIWVMGPEGESPRPVRSRAAAGEEEREHTWSPDGQRLALVARAPGGKARIVVWDARSDQISELTDGRSVDDMPTFSPDGRYLAFVSDRSGEPDVWIMRADGSGAVRAATRPGRRWLPRWSRRQP